MMKGCARSTRGPDSVSVLAHGCRGGRCMEMEMCVSPAAELSALYGVRTTAACRSSCLFSCLAAVADDGLTLLADNVSQ